MGKKSVSYLFYTFYSKKRRHSCIFYVHIIWKVKRTQVVRRLAITPYSHYINWLLLTLKRFYKSVVGQVLGQSWYPADEYYITRLERGEQREWCHSEGTVHNKSESLGGESFKSLIAHHGTHHWRDRQVASGFYQLSNNPCNVGSLGIFRSPWAQQYQVVRVNTATRGDFTSRANIPAFVQSGREYCQIK